MRDLIAREVPSLRPAALHAELEDGPHEETLRAFRDGAARLLVCTAVAVRGLDFPDCRHVVLTDVGTDVATFVHSVGRTARRGEAGVVTVLAQQGSAVGKLKGLHALQPAAALGFA